MARSLASINVGVVGTGFMGVAHTEALRRLGVNVAGVVGSTPERARAKAERANLARVLDGLYDLLADASIDALHVTSSNDAHRKQAGGLLLAGKHVICEKPLALDSNETRSGWPKQDRVVVLKCDPVSMSRRRSHVGLPRWSH